MGNLYIAPFRSTRLGIDIATTKLGQTQIKIVQVIYFYLAYGIWVKRNIVVWSSNICLSFEWIFYLCVINHAKRGHLKQQTFIISVLSYIYSFWSSGIWEKLGWVFLAQSLSWGWSHGRFAWGWRTCFQEGSLRWLVARGPGSPPCGLLHRTLWRGSFSPEQVTWERQRETERERETETERKTEDGQDGNCSIFISKLASDRPSLLPAHRPALVQRGREGADHTRGAWGSLAFWMPAPTISFFRFRPYIIEKNLCFICLLKYVL